MAKQSAGNAQQAHTLTSTRERELTTLHERLLTWVSTDSLTETAAVEPARAQNAVLIEEGVESVGAEQAGDQPTAALKGTAAGELTDDERAELSSSLDLDRAWSAGDGSRRGVTGDGASPTSSIAVDRGRDGPFL